MGLLSSLFSRSPSGDVAEADGADTVARLRTRARQRLIGAVVLVGLGIVVFPLVFETQPRPVGVDVPIEIPRKEAVAPLAMPGARTPAAKASASPAPVAEAPAERVAAAAPTIITETAAEAGLSASQGGAGGSKPAVAERDTEPKTPIRAEPKPEPKPPEPVPATDAARAQALLDGKPAAASAPAGNPRYIVQIGAFADPELAQRTRLKVERLGLVTYTHVAKTPAGDRTRVRVGPVPTREEAEAMATKLKAAGLTAAILTL